MRISPEILNGRMLRPPDLQPDQEQFDQADPYAPLS